MKRKFRISATLLLMLALLLTSCGSKSSEETEDNEEPMATETEQNNQASEAGTTTTEDALDSGIDDAEDEVTEAESEEEEEAEIEVGLFDRALLESVKFNWPDSMMMVMKEESNDRASLITTYQKGYSTREERVTDGVTEIDIYNEDLGIRYSYTLGETTGTSYKDDEDDQLDLEEEKAMVGKSLMSLFEEDMMDDMKILADRDTINGRKAIMIEMLSAEEEEAAEGSMKFWFDAKYTVPLRIEFNFGGDWDSVSEVTDVEFNLRLKDELFEAPKGVTFTDY